MKVIGKIFKITVNLLLVFFILIGALVAFSYFPIPGNYKVFTVQSGSMEPAIHTGSVIFVKPADSYKVGDIVTKKTKDPNMTVTHRITSISEDKEKTLYETKGDANNGADSEKTARENIIGRSMISLPYLGYLVAFARTKQGLAFFVVIPAAIIIYSEIIKISEEIKKRRKMRRLANLGELADESEDKIKNLRLK